jgi:acetyl esterase/lipase
VVVVACAAVMASARPGSATAARVRAEPAASVPPVGSEEPYEILDYRYGADPTQFVNMYFPEGAGPYPVLLYLHSGGWVAGAKEYIPDFLWAQIDRAKVALVSIDYRLSGFAADRASVNAFPVPNQDVDEAIRFVREQAAIWNLDPKRFIASGASAGGHLASMPGADLGQFVSPSLPKELRRVSPDVEGVMDFVGPSDLMWLIHNGIGFAETGVIAYLGCPDMTLASCTEELAKEASPQTYLHRRRTPPAYFAYGGQDTMIPVDTQGLAIAQPWAAVRGETSGTPRSPTACTSRSLKTPGTTST